MDSYASRTIRSTLSEFRFSINYSFTLCIPPTWRRGFRWRSDRLYTAVKSVVLPCIQSIRAERLSGRESARSRHDADDHEQLGPQSCSVSRGAGHVWRQRTGFQQLGAGMSLSHQFNSCINQSLGQSKLNSYRCCTGHGAEQSNLVFWPSDVSDYRTNV